MNWALGAWSRQDSETSPRAAEQRIRPTAIRRQGDADLCQNHPVQIPRDSSSARLSKIDAFSNHGNLSAPQQGRFTDDTGLFSADFGERGNGGGDFDSCAALSLLP
jgi:hypothetical protein